MAKLSKRVARRADVLIKNIYQSFFAPKKPTKDILFIVGCQRSGTTMILNIFDKDYNVKIYREESKLSTLHKTGRKFNPLDQVASEIYSNRVGTIVAKPLVESQNIDRLLDYFDHSKALWVYRHYKDVVSSNLKSFGIQNGLENIAPVYHGSEDNWRSERVSEKTTAIIRQFFSEVMTPQDAAALFWYCRNILFFERGLDKDDRVFLCKYEAFVTSPESTLKNVYSFIQTPYPRRNVTAMVHKGSVRKGRDVQLSREIERHCKELMDQLDAVFTGGKP